MSSKITSVKLPILFKTLSIIDNLGIGIYTAIILVNNPREIVSTEIYGFVMSISIINFIKGLLNIALFCKKENKSGIISLLIDLGLFIWNCIILFDQNIIEYKYDNEYNTVVFVCFLISVISLGMVILIIPFLCCCLCYEASKEQDNTRHNKTITSIVVI